MAERSPSRGSASLVSPPSPLDPFLGDFLREVGRLERGYAPASQAPGIASNLGCPVPFVETLFISARARGLVSVSFERGSRNRWRVSPRGLDWLERSAASPEPAASRGGPLPTAELPLIPPDESVFGAGA